MSSETRELATTIAGGCGPGDMISAEKIEKATGVKREEARYDLEVLKLQSAIEAIVSESVGREVLTRQVKGAIQILTPIQAADYTLDGQRTALDLARRRHVQFTACVRPDDFESSSERAEYYDRQAKFARILLHAEKRSLGVEDD